MKKKLRKIMAAAAAAVCIICSFPSVAFASGSYYVSASSLSLTVGGSGGFTFGATNAVGAFEISTDGGVSASCSAEKWVDSQAGTTVYITVTGNTIGTGHVYITVYDGASYDEEDLSGASYTVTVTVTEPESGTVYNGSSAENTTTTKAAATTTATTAAATTETETTTADPEIELLTVTVDGVSMMVMKEITEITAPEGFSVEETQYNTVTVETLVFDDVRIYILENTEDGSAGYYTLDEETGGFEPLKYTEIDGGMCIFLDFPEGLEIPYGYSLTETELYGFTVEALVFDEDVLSASSETETGSDEDPDSEQEYDSDSESDDEQDASDGGSEVEIKKYYTVGVSGSDEGGTEDSASSSEEETGAETASVTVDELVASSEGHYYIYCVLAGEKVLCDYDSENSSLSRCTALLSIEEDAQEETQAAETEETYDDAAASQLSLALIIAFCAALALAAALAAVLAVVLMRRRPRRGAKTRDEEYKEDGSGEIAEDGGEEEGAVYKGLVLSRFFDSGTDEDDDASEEGASGEAASEPEEPEEDDGLDELFTEIDVEDFEPGQLSAEENPAEAAEEGSEAFEAGADLSQEEPVQTTGTDDASGKEAVPEKEAEADSFSETKDVPENETGGDAVSGSGTVSLEEEPAGGDIEQILSGEFENIMDYIDAD